MSDTEPCPPMTDDETQLTLAFVQEWDWTSHIEGQPLGLPNPVGMPCYCTEPCYLNSHRKL